MAWLRGTFDLCLSLAHQVLNCKCNGFEKIQALFESTKVQRNRKMAPKASKNPSFPILEALGIVNFVHALLPFGRGVSRMPTKPRPPTQYTEKRFIVCALTFTSTHNSTTLQRLATPISESSMNRLWAGHVRTPQAKSQGPRLP